MAKWRSIGSAGAFDPWVQALRGRSGVYLIRRRFLNDLLYIGESHTDRLYETLTRHFQMWSGRTSGPTYLRPTVEVRVIFAPRSKALGLQDRLICKYEPEDNRLNPCAKVPF